MSNCHTNTCVLQPLPSFRAFYLGFFFLVCQGYPPRTTLQTDHDSELSLMEKANRQECRQVALPMIGTEFYRPGVSVVRRGRVSLDIRMAGSRMFAGMGVVLKLNCSIANVPQVHDTTKLDFTPITKSATTSTSFFLPISLGLEQRTGHEPNNCFHCADDSSNSYLFPTARGSTDCRTVHVRRYGRDG